MQDKRRHHFIGKISVLVFDLKGTSWAIGYEAVPLPVK